MELVIFTQNNFIAFMVPVIILRQICLRL